MKHYSSYKDQKLPICGEISVSQCGQLPNMSYKRVANSLLCVSHS